ncbi:MAG: ASKHA domain-containing protein [Phycisphaerae bacterium]
MIYDDGPSLLVDVGTNGEIILKHGDRLLGCATAAGPAFEGAGLACGMRAGEGAIAYIEMSGSPFGIKTQRIGSKPVPEGLCGSAYIDFLAEARRVGLINRMGRFDLEAVGLTMSAEGGGSAGGGNGSSPQVGRVIPWVSHDSPTDRALVLGCGAGSRPIVVAETDVAHLMAAKAAVAAGILTLLKRAGVTAKEIKRVYLAGGFGTHMLARNAIRCGLLPGFEPEQIMPVGNTSAAGAYLGLLDSSALDEMSVLARRVEIVELNLDPDFEDCYIDQLCLPEVEI